MQYKVDPEDALALPSFRSLYALTAVVGLLVGADLLFYWLGYENLRNPFGVNLSLIAALLGGARIVYGALKALLDFDVGADLALAIAMLAALVLKEYWVGAEVVLIAMIGESLEALTFSRTHREIHRILELRPRVVRVRREEQEIEIPAEEVRVGDTVVVRPGERVPVDGTVLVGRSTVDQSTLTGESLPVDKGEGDEIFAGTFNQFGALEVRADVVGEHTTLGQVIQLVAEAQQHKAVVERTADRLARYFLPFVLGLAAITFCYTNYAAIVASISGNRGTWNSQWVWMPTLAVLVVTCPCALILATPATMMAALAWLAKRGVLIKGGIALERLATVTRIAFDKTGTLTEGKLQLGDCLGLVGHETNEVLRLAALAEQSSEHLISRAIVRAAKDQGVELTPVEEFQALPGAGVSVMIRTDSTAAVRRVLVGNRRLMVEQQVSISAEADAALARLEATGQSPLLVAVDQEIVGVLGVRDSVRPEAARVIRELRELGIEEIVMLTGDRRSAAMQVARTVGIERFEAELRPDEKARWLSQWREEVDTNSKASKCRVAMIGDGVNDAPAMVSADVGLALGGVGSDLTAEAGDLVLMGDPLTPLPGLLKLSRETVRIIRQNILVFAFFVNFLGIALTAWIMPSWSPEWEKRSPVAAALFHQMGSVLVLLNAMRLLWFERWNQTWLGRLESALANGCGQVLVTFSPAIALARSGWFYRREVVQIGILILAAVYWSQAIVIVQPDEVAVVQRYGRFESTLEPGLHFRLPPPFDRVTKEKPLRVRTIEIGMRSVGNVEGASQTPIEWGTPHQDSSTKRRGNETIVLTGDQSLVEIGASIQYTVIDLRAFRLSVREPERLLESLAEGVLREVMAGKPLLAEGVGVASPVADPAVPRPRPIEILTNARGSLEGEIRMLLQQRIDALGLGVLVPNGGVCLVDVHPPQEVVDAFRDVSSAFKEKERMKNEAEAYYRDKVIKAGGLSVWQQLSASETELTDEVWTNLRPQLEGEAAAEINAAEAFSIDQRENATGKAQSFLLMESAQSIDPRLTHWRMFIDMIGETLPGKKKLVFDGKSTGRRHLFLGLPQNPTLPPLLTIPPNQRPDLED